MPYHAQDALVAPARAGSALWRLVLGLVLVVAVYFAGMAALFGLLALLAGVWGGSQGRTWIATGDSPIATLIILASFVSMGLGPLLAARFVHRRPLWSLFGPRARLGRQFLWAAGICGVIYGLSALLPAPLAPTQHMSLGLWLSFLPLALLGVLVQTGAEEVLFRGYIQTQLAARFASPIVWMVLPSAVFAALHYQPMVYGTHSGAVVGMIFLFALLAADLTARTGTIGAAWGFHFANNCAAILIVSVEGPLSGLALYTLSVDQISTGDMGAMLIGDLVVMIAVWGTIRWAISRDQGRGDSGSSAK
jgi:membrane protease YdiL (CAAX protease family)